MSSGHYNKEIKMKLSTAIKRLEKSGYKVSGDLGVYIAVKGAAIISFYENGLGSDVCSKFTYDSDTMCSPAYNLNLKTAMSPF